MGDISITALHDPVSIVHIPVSSAPSAATKIYWTLDRARADASEFFNLTSNRIEIALFAAADLVADEWGMNKDAGVVINGPWRVFEVASGDDGAGGANYDSPHLRCVSSPLAEAGISILYQSSYFTDFLLVKSSDFERASAIFRGMGWNCDPVLPPPDRRRSILLSPDLDGRLSSSSPQPHASDTPLIAEITVLTSPLACIGLSADVEASMSERLRKLLVWPERAVLAIEHARGKKANYEADAYDRRNHSRNHSYDDEEERPSIAAWVSARARSRPRPFISYTRTEDGVSVMTEVRVLRGMLNRAERADLGALELEGSDSEWSDDDEVEPMHTPGAKSSASAEEEDGHGAQSHLMSPSSSRSSRGRTSLPAQPGHSLRGCDQGEIPIHWATPPSTPSSARFPFPAIGAFTPITRSSSGSGGSAGGRRREASRARERERETEQEKERARAGERDDRERQRGYQYAREASLSRYSTSSRGSGHARTRSETVTVSVLQHRALAGGLGFVDPRVRRASEGGAREEWLNVGPVPESAIKDESESESETDEAEEEEEEEDARAGMMRCLQLDLRALGSGAYHLDKSGLVMRFSDVLHRGGVRMLYSSTTHTANILVEGRDVIRAEKLLRD